MTDHVDCSAVCVSVERGCPTLPPHGFSRFRSQVPPRGVYVVSGPSERMYPWSAGRGGYSVLHDREGEGPFIPCWFHCSLAFRIDLLEIQTSSHSLL